MATIKECESRKNPGIFTYQARVQRKGYSTITCTFDRRDEAQAWADEQERLIKSGAMVEPVVKSMTVGEAMDEWFASSEIDHSLKEKSRIEILRNIRISIKHVESRLGDTLINDLNVDRVEALIKVLKRPTNKLPNGYSTDSIRLFLAVLQKEIWN